MYGATDAAPPGSGFFAKDFYVIDKCTIIVRPPHNPIGVLKRKRTYIWCMCPIINPGIEYLYPEFEFCAADIHICHTLATA